MLSIAGILTTIDFNVVWRYASLANQALAAVTLWVCTFYMIQKGKYRYGSLITALPAAFMTAVVVTYLCMAEEGFGLSANIGYPIGYLAAAVMIVYYVLKLRQRNTADPDFLTN